MNAIVCGDFNHAPHEADHAAIEQSFEHGRLWDCWTLLNGSTPHAATFQLFDRSYGPDASTFDFVFVSDGLKSRVRSLAIDDVTRASDHQPVAVEIA
jgi:endonuclease/exonuclease/phosphatase family metal-dependent hydrolase